MNEKEIITEESDSWDLIITPRKKWWDLQLRDVWHYRDLIGLFVRRDFVSRYKQTIFGPLWFIIQPLLTSIVFTVIFGNIARLPTDGLPQMLFYMSGNILWSYFSTCLTSTSTTFTANAHLFGKVYFPRLVMPVSIVISDLITFAIQFVFFLAYLLFFYLRGSAVGLTTWAFALPLLLVLMAGLGLGFGIIISSLTTKYRDLQYLVGFGVGLVDVCHAGHLPRLEHPGEMALGGERQPRHADHRDLSGWIPGSGRRLLAEAGLFFWLYAGRGPGWCVDLQPG